MPEVSGRRLLIELPTESRLVAIDRLAATKVPVPQLPFFRRLVVEECRVLFIGHITQITRQIHDLMITKQQVYPATSARRLFLQPHKEVHCGTRLRAAIQKVTCRYEVSLAAAPVQVAINDVGFLQRRYEGVVSTVHITDRNDSIDIGKMPLIRLNR